MKKPYVLLCLALSVAFVKAAPPTDVTLADPVASTAGRKLELADSVLVATHFDQETATAYYQAAVMLSTLPLTPAQRTSLVHALQAMKLFDWSSERQRFDAVEANAYTEQELQSLLGFFSSPVGQKWLKQQHDSDPAMRDQFAAMMKADREHINDGIREARESGQ